MKIPFAISLLLLSAQAALPPPAGAEPLPTAPSLMLAQVYRPGAFQPALHRVSEKYDGVRAYWDGLRLWTRHGRPIAAPAWFTAGWPKRALDGELWAGRGRFLAAASAVAADMPDDKAWLELRYMVFDLPDEPGSFDRRLPVLEQAVNALGQPWVEAVPQHHVADEAGLRELLRRVVADGGEGLVLRRGDAPYQRDRGEGLLKLKPHEDAEARVVAHLPGEGRYAGQVGALLVEMPDGRRFRLGSGLTDADRRRPPPLGAWVTYRYSGLHESGLPRFASFVRVRSD